MNEELDNELSEGKRLATALVMHMLEMNAGKAMIPVFVADEKYEVTVSHVPVARE